MTSHIIDGETTTILFNNHMTGLIDTCDVWLMQNYNWYTRKDKTTGDYYVYLCHPSTTPIDGYKATFLHRHILRAPVGTFVDHINHNTLDNRRNNIRVCSYKESAQNTRAQKDKKYSLYKGVNGSIYMKNGDVLRCKEKPWKAIILGKLIGRYKTEIDAALAYDDKAKELFGEYAYLNFPEEMQDGQNN